MENCKKNCLRASFCKYRESGDGFKIFTFFIFCPNKAFSELFSKIQLKDPKALEFFQNRGKFENRHFGLPPPLKIDKLKRPFLAWGDFHARSRFARSTIPEEKRCLDNGKICNKFTL